MFCTQCGKENISSARFCSGCGQAMAVEASPPGHMGVEQASSTVTAPTPTPQGHFEQQSTGAKADAVASPGKANLFLKHWRGDYSLGISFWVMGIVVPFVSGLVFGGFLGLLAGVFSWSDRTLGGWLTLLTVVVQIWSVVGTWRSASFHVQRGGQAVWAQIVRVLLVLGSVFFVGQTLMDPFGKGFMNAGTEQASAEASASTSTPETSSDLDERAAQWLQKQAVFASIAKYDQPSYAKLHQEVRLALEQGASDDNVRKVVYDMLIQDIIPLYKKESPDAALMRFIGVEVDILTDLFSKAPAACDAMLYPQKLQEGGVNPYGMLSVKLQEQYDTSLDAMVKAKAWTPQPYQETSETKADLKKVVRFVQRELPETWEILKTPEKFKDHPGIICSARIMIYAAVFKEVGNQARQAAIFRAINS